MPADRPGPSSEEAAEQLMVLLIAALVLLALVVLVRTVQGDLPIALSDEQWQAIVRRK